MWHHFYPINPQGRTKMAGVVIKVDRTYIVWPPQTLRWTWSSKSNPASDSETEPKDGDH